MDADQGIRRPVLDPRSRCPVRALITGGDIRPDRGGSVADG